jgi:DNA-binding HxlR family transcriptional regulator
MLHKRSAPIFRETRVSETTHALPTEVRSAAPGAGRRRRETLRPFAETAGIHALTPVARTLRVLDASPRWLVLWLLFWGPRSLQDLLPHSEGVARKALRRELLCLRRLGLVSRETLSTPGTGPQYRLTPLGETLKPTLASLYEWGLKCAPAADVCASRG